MSTTTKSRPLKIAFKLDADGLRGLSELLENNILDPIEVPKTVYLTDDNEVAHKPRYDKKIDYRVGFSDNSSIYSSSLEEVLGLSNSSKRRITSVTLSTPYWSDEIRAYVSFGDNRYSPVSYDLKGEDKEVLFVADKLDDYLMGLRQWYSFLALFSSFAAFFSFS